MAPKLGSIFKMDEDKFVPRVFPDFWGRPKKSEIQKKKLNEIDPREGRSIDALTHWRSETLMH